MPGTGEDRDRVGREMESLLEAGLDAVKIESLSFPLRRSIVRASNTVLRYEYVIRTHRIADKTVRQLSEVVFHAPELDPLILIRLNPAARATERGDRRGSGPPGHGREHVERGRVHDCSCARR